MRKKTQKALDGIYAGPPADFIGGREALAKRLRAEGSEEADAVKPLRKPSKAASVVNALALAEKAAVKRYLGLAGKLRKAASGKVDAKRMRELAREEGELLEELVAAAAKLGADPSASTLDRVRETLQAAQVDPELAERVLAGRVEREARAASVGLDNLASPPQAARKSAPKAERRDAARAGKEAKARRGRVAKAKEAVKEAKAEAREAARAVARAEGALTRAERTRAAADRKVEQAEKRLAALGGTGAGTP